MFLIVALVLLRVSVRADPAVAGSWLTDSRRRAPVAVALNLVSRWLLVAGLVTALVLLIGIGISSWVELLFLVWILALSVDFLTGSSLRSGH